MPAIEASRRSPGQHVAVDKRNRRSGPKPFTSRLQRASRDIEDRHVGEAPPDESPSQRRVTAAHIDDGPVARDGERLDQLKRDPRLLLVPAQQGVLTPSVRRVPLLGSMPDDSTSPDGDWLRKQPDT